MMDEDYDSDWDVEEGEMLEDTVQFWCRLKSTWRKMMEGEGEEEDRREVGGRDVGDESGSGAGMDGDAGRQLGDGDCRVGEGEEDNGVALMDSHQFDGVTRRRVWDGGKWMEKETPEPHTCLCRERGAPGCSSLIQESAQEGTRRCVCALVDWSKQCNEKGMGAAREIGGNRSGW